MRKRHKIKKILLFDFNLTQRANLAKFLYDVAKLGLGGVVITGFMKEAVVSWKLVAGGIFAIIPVLIALFFEAEEKGE